MSIVPTGIQRVSDDAIRIDWSDGVTFEYRVADLRENCPCATCREKRKAIPDPTALPVLSHAETIPPKIAGMKPVGNYAYSIAFVDGHDTGIFTFEFLRKMGTDIGTDSEAS